MQAAAVGQQKLEAARRPEQIAAGKPGADAVCHRQLVAGHRLHGGSVRVRHNGRHRHLIPSVLKCACIRGVPPISARVQRLIHCGCVAQNKFKLSFFIHFCIYYTYYI